MKDEDEDKGTPPTYLQDLWQSKGDEEEAVACGDIVGDTGSQDFWLPNISPPSFQEKKRGDGEADCIKVLVGDDERTGSHSGDPTKFQQESPLYEMIQEVKKEIQEVKKELGIVREVKKKLEMIQEVKKELGIVHQVKKKLEELAKFVGINSPPKQWRKIGGRGELVPAPLKETTVFQLPKDAYSILASWGWKTLPVLISVLVLVMQFGLLIFLLDDILNTNNETDNYLGIPVNVSATVRASQFLAVVIALCSQDDLRIGIAGIFRGVPDAFEGEDGFQQMTRPQWHISSVLRFLQGSVSLFVSWVLILQAQSVFDLLENFLAISFISNLDDLFFALGKFGYLGKSTLRCTEAISSTEFYRRKERELSLNWLGLLVVFVLMLGGLVNIFRLQYTGFFTARTILVEFGDETVPSLGLFNGCYHRDESSKRLVGRLQFVSGSQGGGTLAYCSEKKRWALFDSSAGDECTNFLSQSEETTTFDVLETGDIQWFSKAELPIDFFKLTKVLSEDQCGKTVFKEALESCEKLEFGTSDGIDDDLSSRSRSNYVKVEVSEGKKSEYANDWRLSHAIYVGEEMPNSSPEEVVLFTGRRWVITEADVLPINITSQLIDSSMIQEFFSDDRMRQQGNKNWVWLISEEVNSVKDRGTPLGLRWFYPLYEDPSEDQSSFPGADLAHPYGSVFTCALCDDNTNRCQFGGTCNKNDGTCTCANGAYGNLCQRKPLGDGECHPYFNTAEHSYDGGDCCASTCNGVRCGRTSSSSNPFGIDKKITFRQSPRISDFLFDFNSDEDDPNAIGALDEYYIGYDCKDPEMEPFMIEVSDLDGTNLDDSNAHFACQFGSISVRCNGKSYLQTPQLLLGNESDCSESYKELVYVPYGAKCKLTIDDTVDGPYEYFFGSSVYSVAVHHGNDTASTQIKKDFERSQAEIVWTIPSSKCLMETFSFFSNETVSMFDGSSLYGQAIQELSDNSVGTWPCRDEQERDLLHERYFLSLLNQSFAIQTSSPQADTCEGWGNPIAIIGCDDEERITSLILDLECDSTANSCTLPSEIGFLSRLNDLEMAGIGLQGSLPSELGNLPALKVLALEGNTLSGLIPSELGNPTALNFLYLYNNALSGPIPSELGNLPALNFLYLDSNTLSGPIPSELGNLTALNVLYLLGNQLTGSVPMEIANLSSLQDCFLILANTTMASNKFQDGNVPPRCIQDPWW